MKLHAFIIIQKILGNVAIDANIVVHEFSQC